MITSVTSRLPLVFVDYPQSILLMETETATQLQQTPSLSNAMSGVSFQQINKKSIEYESVHFCYFSKCHFHKHSLVVTIILFLQIS